MARLAIGGFMVGSVVEGHISGDFHVGSWVLGLLVFPVMVLAAHAWMARRTNAPAIGSITQAVAVVAFLALYIFEPTSDAALLFYGGSMLLAAARRTGGCEVFAFSNWVLGRSDEVGCVLFGPVDRLERRHPSASAER